MKKKYSIDKLEQSGQPILRIEEAQIWARGYRFPDTAKPSTPSISNTDIVKVFGRRFTLPAAQNHVKMSSESASLFSGHDRGEAEAGKEEDGGADGQNPQPTPLGPRIERRRRTDLGLFYAGFFILLFPLLLFLRRFLAIVRRKVKEAGSDGRFLLSGNQSRQARAQGRKSQLRKTKSQKFPGFMTTYTHNRGWIA